METRKQTTGRLYGVGVGPGNPDLLTVRAVRVFQSVDTIFHVAGPRTRQSVSKRVVESLDGCADKSHKLTFSMSTDAEEVLTIIPRWNPDRKHVQALEAADTAVCLKTYRDRAVALQAIEDAMVPDDVLYATRVTQDDEVLEWDPETISQLPIDYLSLIIARRHADA